MATYTTRLKDAKGVEHLYSADPFPGSAGYDLFLEVAQILGGPVGNFLQLLLPVLARSAQSGQAFSIADALAGAGVDLSSLPTMLERAPQVLVERGGSAFARKLLGNVRRSRGQADEAKEADLVALGEPIEFDQAFAGNVFECFLAMHWATEINWAPFSQGNTRSWKGLLETLGAPTPETPKTSATENSRPPDSRSKNAGKR